MFSSVKTHHGLALLLSAFILAIILIGRSWNDIVSVADQTIQTIQSIPSSASWRKTQLAQVASTLEGPGAGLVGWWKFDEGSGTTATDSSGNGNNGTLVNGAAWTTDSKVGGGAMSFDGVDDKINTGSDFISTSPLTVSAWIYVRSVGKISGRIIDNGKTWFRIGANQVAFTDNSGTNQAQSSAGSLQYNQWVLVTVTRDNSGVTNIYINGSLSGSPNQNAGAPIGGTTNIVVGNSSYGDRTLDGILDDIRIYNRILSPSEIIELYNYKGQVETSPPPTPPVESPLVITPTVLRSDIVSTTGNKIITALSASFADVNVAVQQAQSGDTVVIPEGVATWSTTLNIANAITLQGSGVDKTKIINGGVNPLIKINPISQSVASQKIRVTDIYFYYHTATGGPMRFINIVGKKNGSYPISQIRIDHNKFEKGMEQIHPEGWIYGVIDHNIFLNGNEAVYITGDGTYAWVRPMEAGTANALFIEDNTFTMNNNIDTINAGYNADSMIYQYEGARTVTRNNIFDATAFTPPNNSLNPQFYDSHGNQRYYTTDPFERGQPILEIYNNRFYTYKATANLFQIRGGSSLIYNNDFRVVNMSKSSSVPYFFEEESSAVKSFPILRTQWPAEDAHTNTFIWNNTCNWTGGVNNCNGSNITDAYVSGSNTTFIQKDRDYFMHEPQASGGKSVYTGRIGASNTYPTNSNSDTLVFNSSGPNAYYPYTPYVYPHPLVSGIIPPVAPPPPNQNPPLYTPTIGDFNADGIVNSIDLSLMITAWNTNNATYDLNRDGIVNSLDYVIMVRNWTM